MDRRSSQLIAHSAFRELPWEALVYQIMGHSELQNITIPNARRQDPGPSGIEKTLLEISQVLESVYTVLVAKGDDAIIVESESLFRIIAYTCNITNPSSPSRSGNDFSTLRQYMLRVLECTLRIYGATNVVWSLKEVEWVREQMSLMAKTWERHAKLSALEQSIYQNMVMLISAPTKTLDRRNTALFNPVQDPGTKGFHSPTTDIQSFSPISPSIPSSIFSSSVQQEGMVNRYDDAGLQISKPSLVIAELPGCTPSSVYNSQSPISPITNDYSSLEVVPKYQEPIGQHRFNTGLEVVEQPRIEPDTYPLSRYAPQPDALSVKTQSSVESSSVRKWGRLFNRIGGSKRSSIRPLPPGLEFCFSSCAQHLWFWSKRSVDHIVRLRYPFTSGERIVVQIPNGPGSPPNGSSQRGIRHLAATQNVVVAVVHIDESRWLYILHENVFRPLQDLDKAIPTVPTILSLAVSPDGTHISLGCGNFTLLYEILNGRLSHPFHLASMETQDAGVVLGHKINFSVDSRKFVSAVQVQHGAEHAVYISIWKSVSNGWQPQVRLRRVHLIVGYPNDTGITFVSLVDNSQAFLTAALAKKYPSIISTSLAVNNKPLDIEDKRIDCASQCLFSPNTFAVQSGRSQIFVVDSRNGTSQKVADLSSEMKGLRLHQDRMKVAVLNPETILVVWKTAKENVVLTTCFPGKEKPWDTETEELGPIFRHIAGFL